MKAFKKLNIFLILYVCFLFIYVLLRAFYLEPLHDEVATFIHYIETGKIIGNDIVLDANNHFINSYWGRFMFVCFGENYFNFRLLSVISFLFYAIGIWRLCNLTLKDNINKVLLFIGLISIPWILDYFSYTRGYATAITCFIWAIYFLLQFIHSKKLSSFFWMAVLLILTLASNLIYVSSSILLIAFAFGFFLFFISNKSLVYSFKFYGILFLLILGIVPFLLFSFDLKEAGALYYGSLNGFWKVTLKSLSKNVLFIDFYWLKYVFYIAGMLMIFLIYLKYRKETFSKIIQKPIALFLYLLLGNVLMIYSFAKILGINYPEDRAGMYLIPISFFLISIFFETFSKQFYHYLFLFFPLSLFINLNLTTSIFSPEDRMSKDFYSKVRKQIKSDEALSVYPIQGLTYSSLEKSNEHHKHIAKSQKFLSPYTDFVITKKSMLFPKKNLKYYKEIAYHVESNHVAFRRKVPFKKELIFDSIFEDKTINDEFILFFDGQIDSTLKKYPIQLTLEGLLTVLGTINTMNLVISTENKQHVVERYDGINLRWYYGNSIQDKSIYFPNPGIKFNYNDNYLKIYLWNPDHLKVKLKNTKILFYQLK